MQIGAWRSQSRDQREIGLYLSLLCVKIKRRDPCFTISRHKSQRVRSQRAARGWRGSGQDRVAHNRTRHNARGATPHAPLLSPATTRPLRNVSRPYVYVRRGTLPSSLWGLGSSLSLGARARTSSAPDYASAIGMEKPHRANFSACPRFIATLSATWARSAASIPRRYRKSS